MTYIVFVCPRCRLVRYAKEWQKTAACLKCGYRINPAKVRIIARAKTVNEAIEIVKLYKIKRRKEIQSMRSLIE